MKDLLEQSIKCLLEVGVDILCKSFSADQLHAADTQVQSPLLFVLRLVDSACLETASCFSADCCVNRRSTLRTLGGGSVILAVAVSVHVLV